MLDLVNVQSKARGSCILLAELEGNRSNGFSPEYTGSTLLTVTMADRNSRSSRFPSRKSIFCRGDYWPEKCNAITDPIVKLKYVTRLYALKETREMVIKAHRLETRSCYKFCF